MEVDPPDLLDGNWRQSISQLLREVEVTWTASSEQPVASAPVEPKGRGMNSGASGAS